MKMLIITSGRKMKCVPQVRMRTSHFILGNTNETSKALGEMLDMNESSMFDFEGKAVKGKTVSLWEEPQRVNYGCYKS